MSHDPFSAQHPLACIILGAGMGTRMVSRLPKVLHTVAGRALINWLLETVESLSPDKTIVVSGPDRTTLASALPSGMEIAVQTDRKGTGDAVRAAIPVLGNFSGDVLILMGDAPFVSRKTLARLVNLRRSSGAGLAVAAVDDGDPSGYGRMSLDADGFLNRIIEDKDCTPEEKKIRLWNPGLYCVDGARLAGWIGQIGNANAQGEYYLTDLPIIAAREGVKTSALICDKADEFVGINTREQLAETEKMVQKRLRRAAMKNGVTLVEPKTVYFSWDTKIGQDVTIGPHVVFGPGVTVADGAEILPFCHIEGATIGTGARVGPFARLRRGTVLDDDVHIGNFVEIKNTTIGKASKAGHLTYLGDAEIGLGCNIGAGTITCNYDGFDKHKTTIGTNAFVGSDVTLVAPVSVGDGSYIGAGSTITRDVPTDALAVARTRPLIRDGWAKGYREKKGRQREHSI